LINEVEKMSINPGFSIGPIYIHFYGILIMLGVLAAAWLSLIESKRKGEDPEIVWDCVAWLLVGGILGARIWHILTPPASMNITTLYYLTHPLDAIAIWKGGLGIPGAVIGGVLALYLYTRSRKISLAMWVDIIAPGLALAQAIGRWGNFVNQELYGSTTTLPWGISIDTNHLVDPYLSMWNANPSSTNSVLSLRYHPLFLYESLYNLANMFLLLWLSRQYDSRLKKGDVFLIYLITYPVGRFFLEFLRLDPSRVAGLNINQTLMAVVAIAAAAALIIRHRGGGGELAFADVEGEEALEVSEESASTESTVSSVSDPATDNGEPGEASANVNGGK
jgi:phosphatidylglycerol:prolipoprotein diacylglycerol transferase